MRNLLALAALGLLVFLGLGWYLDWYKVKTETTGDGHRQIEVDLNTNKIKADLKKGESKVHDWLNDKDGNGANTVAPGTTPGITAPGTTISFRPSENTSVFPGSSPPPSGSPTLPTPR